MVDSGTFRSRMGRPRQFGPGERRYTSVALTRTEEEQLTEWAYRLRTNRSELMRSLIREGLKRYMDDAKADEKWPLGAIIPPEEEE